jgi:hypothetical protein
MSDLQLSDMDIYLKIQKHICNNICGRDDECRNLACMEYMLRITGEVQEKHAENNSKPHP